MIGSQTAFYLSAYSVSKDSLRRPPPASSGSNHHEEIVYRKGWFQVCNLIRDLSIPDQLASLCSSFISMKLIKNLPIK